MTVTAFDHSRTFGVEIEFTNLSERDIRKLERKLTAAGIPTVYEGYNHITRSTWKIVYDGSVKNTKHYCGWELVSPPLKGLQGLQALKTAMKVLDNNGAKVNRSCGLHVHHDASNWGIKEFKNVYRLYSRMELTIDKAMPKSRRSTNNGYCRSIREHMAHSINAFEACKTVEDLRRYWGGNRYYKVNMESWYRHSTIEFRHHSGTTDADKIINWVVFTQLIVGRAESTRRLKVDFDDRRYKRDNPWRLVAVEFALHNKGNEMDELIKGAIEWISSRITHFRELEVAA